MQALIDLLTHRYLVLNHIAESVYDEATVACHQRLRSRVQGRHRFTVEDYKTLRKEALAFSRRLDRKADQLEAALGQEGPVDWKSLVSHPWLNLKEVLADAGAPFGYRYSQAYDRLRVRTPPPEGFIRGIATRYRDFAQHIRTQLDTAHAHRKDYVFSAGRGGGSHRPKD